MLIDPTTVLRSSTTARAGSPVSTRASRASRRESVVRTVIGPPVAALAGPRRASVTGISTRRLMVVPSPMKEET
ncbi:hypothetical protein JF66_12810 [Cryobacterium sp. MLB-32]|nr:hypothetical protein JF66_12810 [Cryobacterium sp. MLB-32]